MSDEKPTTPTSGGVPVTDDLIDQLAAEADDGYDVARGRRRLGSAPAEVVPVRSHDAIPGLPDAHGFMTYASRAEPIQQSGWVMRQYKDPIPIPSAERTVRLLTALAVRGHRHCPSQLVGVPLTAWAYVPSLPVRHGTVHPLAAILRSLARPGSVEIVLDGVDNPADPRALDPANFTVRSGVPDGAHVLLIEDTWVSGGHAQSAALALRLAGAAHVSLLALARWLWVGWDETTDAWIRSHLAAVDYNPDICPWTQQACPA
jgi:hypothetical protein